MHRDGRRWCILRPAQKPVNELVVSNSLTLLSVRCFFFSAVFKIIQIYLKKWNLCQILQLHVIVFMSPWFILNVDNNTATTIKTAHSSLLTLPEYLFTMCQTLSFVLKTLSHLTSIYYFKKCFLNIICVAFGIALNWWDSTGGDFASQRTFGNSWRYSACFNQGGVVGFWWAETRDTNKHPTMDRTAPQRRIILPKMSIVPRLTNPMCVCVCGSLKGWDWKFKWGV